MEQQPDTEQAAPTTVDPAAQTSAKSSLKKYFLYIMIIGLVASALISVVAVLTGDFNEFTTKALSTTFLSVIHSLVFLAIVSKNERNERKSDVIIINTVLGIAIISFILSILGVWQLVDDSIVGRGYIILFYTFLLCFVAKVLLSVDLANRLVRTFTYTSLGLAFVLYLLLIPPVFVDYPAELPQIYYRIMSALAILFATSSVLTAIFEKLHKNTRAK